MIHRKVHILALPGCLHSFFLRSELLRQEQGVLRIHHPGQVPSTRGVSIMVPTCLNYILLHVAARSCVRIACCIAMPFSHHLATCRTQPWTLVMSVGNVSLEIFLTSRLRSLLTQIFQGAFNYCSCAAAVAAETAAAGSSLVSTILCMSAHMVRITLSCWHTIY